MEDAQGSIGDVQGVFEHLGCWGHQGTLGGVQMHGGIQTYGCVKMPPNIWGCQLSAPKCRIYMPPKNIRGV